MSQRAFFTEDARSKVAAVVAEVEAQTSVEIVVALRKASGHYRHADYLAAILVSVASLLIFLFYPEPFDSDLYAIEAVGFFTFGLLTSAFFPPRRRITPRDAVRMKSTRLSTSGHLSDPSCSMRTIAWVVLSFDCVR